MCADAMSPAKFGDCTASLKQKVDVKKRGVFLLRPRGRIRQSGSVICGEAPEASMEALYL